MEFINQFLFTITGSIITEKWLVISLVAFSVFFLVIALCLLLNHLFDPIKQRMDNLTKTQQSNTQSIPDTVHKLGSYFIIENEKKISYDQERLLHAGYREKNNLAQYYGIKTVLMVTLSAFSFLICRLFFPSLPQQSSLLIIGCALITGFIFPSILLDKLVKKRKRIIRNYFPDVIDQLIVCVESGLGLDSSLQRIANDIALSNETMSYELELINSEIQAGVNRDQAFKNLVARTGVDGIRSLASTLSQSMRFGTSLSDTLRIYADDMRDKRMQNAEEEAAKLAIKMLFPLVLCFFPGIFIIILGPAIISINAAFNL
nr:type II secretion system F family protein [Rhodospirillales bacterium]